MMEVKDEVYASMFWHFDALLGVRLGWPSVWKIWNCGEFDS